MSNTLGLSISHSLGSFASIRYEPGSTLDLGLGKEYRGRIEFFSHLYLLSRNDLITLEISDIEKRFDLSIRLIQVNTSVKCSNTRNSYRMLRKQENEQNQLYKKRGRTSKIRVDAFTSCLTKEISTEAVTIAP